MIDSLDYFRICSPASVTVRKTKTGLFLFCFVFQFEGHKSEGQIRLFNNELIFIFILQQVIQEGQVIHS